MPLELRIPLADGWFTVYYKGIGVYQFYIPGILTVDLYDAGYSSFHNRYSCYEYNS